ncbi:MAG: AAA family ATPase [Clostridia bacterium]|nr:AAA family ATPase [Clostridia bacterium]
MAKNQNQQNTARGVYEWVPQNRLTRIDDVSLARARSFWQRGFVEKVEIIEKKNEDTGATEHVVKLSFNVVICIPIPDEGEVERDNDIHFLTRKLTQPLNYCGECTCNENRCVPEIAAYMKYLSDRGMLDAALKERAVYRETSGRGDAIYEFDWTPEKPALQEVPDPVLELAERVLDKKLVTLRPRLSDQGYVLIDFDNRICASLQKHDPAFSSTDLVLALDRLGDEPSNMKDGVTVGIAFDPTRATCASACPNCKCEYCIPVLAAYLKYCRGNGLADKIEEAAKTRAVYPENVRFSTREPACRLTADRIEKLRDELTTLPLNLLETVIRMTETNRVSVIPYTPKDDGDEDERTALCTVCIRFYKSSKRSLTGSSSIEDFELGDDAENQDIYPIPVYSLDFLSKEINFANRIIIVAAVVGLLRQHGISSEALLSERSEVLDRFLESSRNTPGLERIMKLAKNEKTNSLYCVVEGARNSGKQQVVENIADVLAQHGKIKTKEYQRCTFDELVRTFVRQWNPEYRDGGDPYSFPSGKYYAGYKFNVFEKNVLYVISGLSSFLKSLKSNEYGMFETDHIKEILGRALRDTYIVIIGLSAEDVEEFLSLDSRYKFLYGRNVLHLENMTTEQIYEAYISELSDDVRAKIEDPEEFRKTFAEFMAFNEKFLPIGNTELVNYLSNYSNVEGAPVLPPNVYNNKKAAAALDEMIGMKAIKEQVRDFESFISFQKKAKAAGINVEHGNMHMQFLGNPGTGKTTVARIIATMLFDIGVLQKNKLVEVERKDLVAPYVGQTAIKTSEKIKEAMGGVLFIDEAYSLALTNDDSYGKEAIATLVKAMEDYKDKFIVILAGYDKEMGEFLNSNSGIESRIGYTFRFDNYSVSELSQMYVQTLSKQNFTVTPEAVSEMERVTEYFINRRYFGNGRFVKKMVQDTIIKHSKNESAPGWEISVISMPDVPSTEEMSAKNTTDRNPGTALSELVGLESVKEQIKKFRTTTAFRRKAHFQGINIPRGNNHMIFSGNPGTGKTTVARIIARELYDAGIISENKLIECGRQDLVGQYLGQTAPKTQQVVNRAIGGVLFIDEAYSLTGGANGHTDSYGDEAIATLVKAMEDYRDNLVVIFSGYEKEMDRFISSNPGIASRIGFTFRFEDYSAEELTEIFRRKISKSGLDANAPETLEKVRTLMQYFVSVPNFGNGRFAERVVQTVFELHAERCASFDDPVELKTVTPEDVPSVKYVLEHLANGDDMINPEDIKEDQHVRTAFHELGHAVVCKILFPDNPIERITISAEGSGALGYVRFNTGAVGNMTATELRNRICVNMAGIASEEVFLGEYGNGGTSDLDAATDIAWQMVSRYGMSRNGFSVTGEKTDRDRAEIDEILKQEFSKAKGLISERAAALERAKDVLLEKKTITEEEFLRILNA